MNKIKALIFDIDETLVDRKAAFLSLCNYLIDKYADEYPYEGSKAELIKYLIEIDANGYGGLETFIPKLSKVWKLPLTVQEFIDERNRMFGKFTVVFPEAFEVLEYMKAKYKLGVITNGYSTVQREKISVAGIEGYFDDIIVSEETGTAKPDPRIFLLSCGNLGVEPEEAVYVGDYYPNDIAGAISANIMPIWISDNTSDYKDYSGIRVTALKDLLQLL